MNSMIQVLVFGVALFGVVLGLGSVLMIRPLASERSRGRGG